MSNYIIPENLKYTKTHEWVKIENNIAIIGITDYAQQELGDIVFVEVNTLNKELNRFESFGTIEAVKTVSDLFMPISGKIIESNEKLKTNPELINKDPYGEGWIIKAEIINISEIENLLNAEDYKKLIEA